MGTFKQLCLPEDRVSLKLVFDHLKNWAIVGGTLVVGVKALKPNSGIPVHSFAGAASIAVGTVLAVCLMAQAWYMFDAFTDQFAEAHRSKAGTLVKSQSLMQRIVGTVMIIAVGALITGFFSAIFLVGSAIVGDMLDQAVPRSRP